MRELAGSAHVFAHNGDLPGIEQRLPHTGDHYRPIGNTDSEHAYCVSLERVHAAHHRLGDTPSLDQRLDLVAAFAAELRSLGPANFLYADGDALFAHGHRRFQPATARVEPPGLYLVALQCTAAGIDTQGVSVSGAFQQVVLAASFPLSTADWRPLAEGEVVAIVGGEVRARRSG